eukprot:SAG22_NODE_10321_length_541_cov_1.280543_2_plen_45_part_01
MIPRYSIRVAGFRYTEWLGWDRTKLRPIWGSLNATELVSADTFSI